MATHHHEGTVVIAASPEQVFAFVDDHSRLSSHMGKSSWMMGGGRMRVDLDEGKGQAIGSHIRLSGSAFGLRIFLDEVVTRRNPPTDKVWKTVGDPRLLVIGAYRMGVQISPQTNGSRLRVFIDYELPRGRVTHCLGAVFAGMYARWCVKQMLTDAAKHLRGREVVAAA